MNLWNKSYSPTLFFPIRLSLLYLFLLDLMTCMCTLHLFFHCEQFNFLCQFALSHPSLSHTFTLDCSKSSYIALQCILRLFSRCTFLFSDKWYFWLSISYIQSFHFQSSCHFEYNYTNCTLFDLFVLVLNAREVLCCLM